MAVSEAGMIVVVDFLIYHLFVLCYANSTQHDTTQQLDLDHHGPPLSHHWSRLTGLPRPLSMPPPEVPDSDAESFFEIEGSDDIDSAPRALIIEVSHRYSRD